MGSVFTALNNALFEGVGSLRQGIKQLDALADVDRGKKAILARVAEKLKPALKHELAASYARSGLAQVGDFKAKNGDEPGALYKAAIASVTIVPSPSGLKAMFPPGLNKHVYARGGLFNYGGVYGHASAKAKRKLKKSAGGESKNLGGGYRTVASKDFFKLAPDQVERLLKSYLQFWNEELAPYARRAGT